MKKATTKARRDCANYFNGTCLGVMMGREEGKLVFCIDKDFAGMECIADSGKCQYFNNIVVRGIGEKQGQNT